MSIYESQRRLYAMSRLIRCPICKTNFGGKDIVDLDILNTITHSQCVGKSSDGYPVKDSGVYAEILERYPFFGERVDVN